VPEIVRKNKNTHPVPEIVSEDKVPGEGLSKCFVEVQDLQ
jgi:hypothetical protein